MSQESNLLESKERRALSGIPVANVENRKQWVERFASSSGLDFGSFSKKIETDLALECASGIDNLLGHLRLCGVIPEQFGHDTTEEKIYSKYTDIIIHEAYKAIGCTSAVLQERADVADVECVADDYSFVADAKAFRLSRTAKNQKDFKVQAMDRWKHGKPFAMIVCPFYQLPSNNSQIYHQAATSSVCISTYSHLSVLVQYAVQEGEQKAKQLLHELFKLVDCMMPSKKAADYWQSINKVITDFDASLREIWVDEKVAAAESIFISKSESLEFLASERERVMGLSREEAIKEVLEARKIENKIIAVESVADNGLLEK